MTDSKYSRRGDRLAKVNTVLAICTALLIAFSAFAYHDSVRRAQRFERGQKFLPNLNPDEIATIEIKKGGETTQLRRDGEHFIVVSEGKYPASNEAVNRLIRNVLGLSLEKKVGQGETLTAELGLAANGAGSSPPGGIPSEDLEVAFGDAAGKDMVRFRVGKGLEDGGGSYVMRTDEGADPSIYLTASRVSWTTEGDAYLDKEILSVEASKIRSITGRDYQLVRAEEGAPLDLAKLPAGKQANRPKVDEQGNLLSSLRFTRHILASAEEVRGLSFGAPLEVVLEDGSGYKLAIAEGGDKHYLQIEGFHTAGRLEVSMEASEEEVRETSDVLVRADEITAFNTLHGSWIYEVPSFFAEKVMRQKKDLLGAA